MEPGSLHALDITVGAIFPRGRPLPDTGQIHTLYRYFTIPADERLISGNRRAHDASDQRVIGMALTAPIADITYWLYLLRNAGATWTWSCQDVNSQGQAMMIDQNQIYGMLDQGIGILDIARRLNYSASNVRVVYRKWRRESQESQPQKSPVRQQG